LVPSQLPPQVPEPAQTVCPLRGAPLTATQVPGLAASAQASQAPVQATLQQTPSAQKPLTHWLAAVHTCPAFSLQEPVASHDFVLVQLSVSSTLVTATHVPPPPVHAWQVPHEAVPQQVPSTQAPVAQSEAAVQVCPLAFLQAPVASHDCVPLQRSSIADFTGLQVPARLVRLQAVQAVLQALLQQYPSAQKPLVHSPAAAQVCPFVFFGTHLPAPQ